jgi:hypothetical protein
VKVTVRADQIDLATRLLQLSKPEAEPRAITFYDTPALELYSDGLILRSRKLQDGSGDSTVKLRGLDAGRIDAGWLQQRGCRCEEDWVGDAAVPACSYSAKQRKGEIDEVAAGRRGVHKLYSAGQERFAAAYAPRALDFTRLRAFGPVQAFVWKRDVAELGDRLTIERWELPDGTALLELSVRVPRTDAAAARGRLLGFLQARGLDTSSQQETKTRVVLEYFSSR